MADTQRLQLNFWCTAAGPEQRDTRLLVSDHSTSTHLVMTAPTVGRRGSGHIEPPVIGTSSSPFSNQVGVVLLRLAFAQLASNSRRSRGVAIETKDVELLRFWNGSVSIDNVPNRLKQTAGKQNSLLSVQGNRVLWSDQFDIEVAIEPIAQIEEIWRWIHLASPPAFPIETQRHPLPVPTIDELASVPKPHQLTLLSAARVAREAHRVRRKSAARDPNNAAVLARARRDLCELRLDSDATPPSSRPKERTERLVDVDPLAGAIELVLGIEAALDHRFRHEYEADLKLMLSLRDRLNQLAEVRRDRRLGSYGKWALVRWEEVVVASASFARNLTQIEDLVGEISWSLQLEARLRESESEGMEPQGNSRERAEKALLWFSASQEQHPQVRASLDQLRVLVEQSSVSKTPYAEHDRLTLLCCNAFCHPDANERRSARAALLSSSQRSDISSFFHNLMTLDEDPPCGFVEACERTAKPR